MYNKKSFSNYTLVLLLDVLLILVFYFLDYFFTPQNQWLYFILVVILISTLTFAFLEYRYNKKLSSLSNEINKCLIKITTNNDPFNELDYSEDLSLFYNSFKKVRESLDEKEGLYKDILDVVDSIALDLDLDKLLENVVPKLVTSTNSSCGAFYILNKSTNSLEIKYSIGFSKNIYSEFDLSFSEGLLGVNLHDSNINIINDIPDDTIFMVRTFLGKMKPKSIMIVPIKDNEDTIGVLLLSSIYAYKTTHKNIIDVMRSYIGISIKNGLIYDRSKRLTNELQFQNKLIHDLNNDLEKKVLNRTMFLNNIIDSIEDYAIYATNPEFIITTWNKGAEKIIGYKDSFIKGQKLDMLFVKNELDEMKYNNIIKCLDENGKFREQTWQYREDGTKYYAETIIFKMLNPDSIITGYTGVTRDITEKKAFTDGLWIEKGFTQKLLETSRRSLLVTDENGFIELCNENSLKILETEMLVGKNLDSLFEKNNSLERDLAEVLKTSEDFIDKKYYLKDTDKTLKLRMYKLSDKDDIISKIFIHITI